MLYRWPAKQTIPLSVLARNQTYLEVVRGRGKELVRERSWQAVGVEPRTGAVNTGAMRPAEKIESRDVGIPVALWNFR